MPEIETEVFLEESRTPFFMELADGLHRAENILTLEDAERLGIIEVLKYNNRTIIISQENTTSGGKSQEIGVLESAHSGQVKGMEVTLKPPSKCGDCGAKLESRTVISEDHIDHVNCPNCDSRNDAELIETPKTYSGIVVKDDRTFTLDYEGPAEEVLEAMKTFRERLGDAVFAKDTPLENTLKPLGDTVIRVWDFENDGDVSVDFLCVQIGDVRTSVHVAEDLTVFQDDEKADEGETINYPSVIGKLTLKEVVENEDLGYDVLLVEGANGVQLPLYILYDESSNPIQCIVSSKALTKGGWRIRATNDASDDSESYFDLRSALEDTGLLEDTDDWEAQTELPFGTITVEYSSDADDGIPPWAVRMEEAGYPPEDGVLYVNIDIPNADMGNLKISHSSSHEKKGKKK